MNILEPKKEKISLKEFQKLKNDLKNLQLYIENFLSFLPLAICILGPTGVITNINKAFESLSGYKNTEIIGNFLENIFLEKTEIREFLREIERGRATEKFSLISKSQKKIRVNVSAAQRKDRNGNFIGYFLSITDISELEELQKGLEEKVRERTKELERIKSALMNILDDTVRARRRSEEERKKTLSVFMNFTDGLLVFDIGDKLSLINPQAKKIFNFRDEDVVGKSISELSTFSQIKPLIDLVTKEKKEIFKKELKLREDLILEVTFIFLMAEKERFGSMIILHNITREKRVERMKTEFVSISAHQLRTPLSAIKWTLRMLLDGDVGKITSEQRYFLEKIYLSNERMVVLINDLLNVTRIEEGRYLFNPIPSDIEEITRSVVKYYKDEIKKKDIKLNIKKEEKKKLPKVMADVEKMSLAIQNLLDNAVKYTPKGGKITISFKENKNEIQFSISDTGIGIPKGQEGRIFTKFFRGINALKVETNGSGLGLFIAKNIIEAHGGKIWFKSTEGKGTTFYFTVPVRKETAELLSIKKE